MAADRGNEDSIGKSGLFQNFQIKKHRLIVWLGNIMGLRWTTDADEWTSALRKGPDSRYGAGEVNRFRNVREQSFYSVIPPADAALSAKQLYTSCLPAKDFKFVPIVP